MKVASPCVGVCKLDERGVCRGCFRTLKEIAAWSTMSEAEKDAVVRRLPKTTWIKTCPQCGDCFPCKAGACWCDNFPTLSLSGQPESDCLCPACLSIAIEASRRKTGAGSAAFTLVELLVVIAIIGILAGLLFPVLSRSKGAAQRAQCANSLHQFGLAAEMYWDDNNGNCFAYRDYATNNGYLYWFGWLQNGAEGQRQFDATQGALYPYIHSSGIDICPAFNYTSPEVKLKATGAAFGYGYNFYLSPTNGQAKASIQRVVHPANTAFLADSAQVNNFEAPASPSHPMLEEFFYVDLETNYSRGNNYPNGHFRHQQKANVVFCDGHVGAENFVPGSLDQKLPSQFVGQLRSEILTIP